MKMKFTVLTNIFNEEYLLPFWLLHHRDIFDHGIIIDYNSTDKSVEICKKLCPSWTIIQTKNKNFGAPEIDKEFMEIENSIEGVKIVLNTTEFLFCKKQLNEIFTNNIQKAYSIIALSPYSKNYYFPKNNLELFKNLLEDDVVFSYDRGYRYIHNYSNGNYTLGRHDINHPKIKCDDLFIIWLGFYPFNNHLLKRKLQIQQNMPERDKINGWGFQHVTSENNLIQINQKRAYEGKKLVNLNFEIFKYLSNKYSNKTFIVTGGCGFIGSHMVDRLIKLNYKVIVIDNVLSGNLDNLNKQAIFINADIRNFKQLNEIVKQYDQIDGIFHFAAIARTPWCIEDPILCYEINVMGTLNILELARQNNIKRVVLSSSNVVYAFLTPYRTSKQAVEELGKTYQMMYNLSVVSLRYSNVYGPRQSELGPSPNVFAALRKSKKENGFLLITGDGKQTRNYTHVYDIVEGNLLSMFSNYCGEIDLCTGISIELNEAASYFNVPIKYIDERPGDVKHIIQDPSDAYKILGWKYEIDLKDGIKDVL